MGQAHAHRGSCAESLGRMSRTVDVAALLDFRSVNSGPAFAINRRTTCDSSYARRGNHIRN